MVLVGTTTNSGFGPGVFNGDNPYTLPTPFDGSFQVEYAYYSHTLNGFFWGHSTLATGYSLAVPPSPTTATFGLGANQVLGFTLVPIIPEPSTWVLGISGGAALWLFRRKQG
jgi:hypothetical protein